MQQTSIIRTTGDRITAARKRAELNQTELADLVHVSRSTVSRWEQGRGHAPNIAELERIANALHVSLAWLIGAQD